MARELPRSLEDLPEKHRREALRQLAAGGGVESGTKIAHALKRLALNEGNPSSQKPAGGRPARRIRQNQKPLLNALETKWAAHLAKAHPDWIVRGQAIRFRLANGLWYKPDFTSIGTHGLWAWEVKGPHAFRGGFENLKMAASKYPEWRWILVWQTPGGGWQTQAVLP